MRRDEGEASFRGCLSRELTGLMVYHWHMPRARGSWSTPCTAWVSRRSHIRYWTTLVVHYNHSDCVLFIKCSYGTS